MTTHLLELNFTFPQLFFGISNSIHTNLLKEAFEVYCKFPEIHQALVKDQVSFAQEKKLLRLLDKEHELSDDQALFELMEADLDPAKLKIGTGRPAMPPQALFAFIILQGKLGSMEDVMNYEHVSRHIDIRKILARLELKGFPTGRSITQNISQVSYSTRSLILQAQLAYSLDEELDDFQDMTPDSTFVKANSSWPTDSGLLLGLLDRVYTMGQNIHERSGHVLPNFSPWHLPRWLDELNKLNFEISMAQNKANAAVTRLKAYRQIYQIADKALRHLDKQLDDIKALFKSSTFKPSLEQALKRYIQRMEESLEQVVVIMLYSEDRVVNGAKIPADEKVYSLADPTAYMICKGQREPVIGYRPTVARTGSGLIGALYIEMGNPKDTTVFQGAIEEYIAMTGVTPKRVCTDAGYASEKNYQWALKVGVELCSFTGALGRKIMTNELYDSDETKEFRSWRSSSESSISFLKGSYRFGRMSRRGEVAVKNEMMDKILAHNFDKIAELKRRKVKQQDKNAA